MVLRDYYEGLSADYSRPGLVSEELKATLIQRSDEIGNLQEAKLPVIGPDYTLQQMKLRIANSGLRAVKRYVRDAENFWPKSTVRIWSTTVKMDLITGLKNNNSVKNIGGQLLPNQVSRWYGQFFNSGENSPTLSEFA